MSYTTVSAPDFVPEMPHVSFMGMEFDPFDTDATVEALLDRADRGLAFDYLVTPNVDHIVRLEAEPDLRPLYEAAGMLVCDSRILEIFARFEGKTLPAAPGADVVASLIQRHIQPDEKIVIIGGDDAMLEALARDYAITNIAWHNPPMGLRHKPDAVREAAEFLVRENERFAFLCVGSPQQEMIAKAAKEIGRGRGMALCCGASLDFLSGKTARAPLWMRNARLEWLHRLLSEPGRMWKRYLIDGPRILKIWMRYR
ncbi:WecB/TagA/CpsF family glycosyltransferase [Ponticaulis sp.]|uniref:WecB/TagA/CpsF family glycosyltransferase n=1 Tax=Ponticaulis sp. TaxID=2020902 RepID=UPI0025F97FEF|nr:WecB/TagA/CpsF family glycosyltransferase [Ponticaulis sp.]|tara:strand:+ start:143664 stop:144431 length:768 start_codon:yes stop_codon:yes gene_type:complete